VTRASRCCLVLLLLLALALAACGETRRVREPDLVIEGDAPAAPSAPESAPSSGGETLRISVVTHGQAANPFWVIVRNGIDAAARQLDVSVSYRAPDTFSIARMRTLIDAAVAGRPDGLVVSIPSPGVEGSIRRAVEAGIPVISMNSGSDAYRRLGALAHIGQPEDRAGAAAGARFAQTGVRRALCVNQEQGNVGLVLRCRGFVQAIRRAGGDGDILSVDVQDRTATRQRLIEAIRSRRTDGVMTLDTLGADAALDAVRSAGPSGSVRLATFDLSPEVLEAVRDGRMRFAVDQQPYMQGYLPVVLLTQRIRYGLFAAEHELLPTGPTFVTRASADRILRLSERGIR
jgi:simple sugar transport system substrate-binding protein